MRDQAVVEGLAVVAGKFEDFDPVLDIRLRGGELQVAVGELQALFLADAFLVVQPEGGAEGYYVGEDHEDGRENVRLQVALGKGGCTSMGVHWFWPQQL